MRTNYNVSIVACSKELSAKERVSLKTMTDAVRLDSATADGAIDIYPAFWAELAIHNEKSQDKDYSNYLIVDKDGNKYVTGSNSFWDSFNDIADEMKDETVEWGIKVFQQPSKNYAGKGFITCVII